MTVFRTAFFVLAALLFGASAAMADTSVTVEVTSGGQPVEGVNIDVLDDGGNVIGSGKTGADGKIRVPHLDGENGETVTARITNNGTRSESAVITGGKTKISFTYDVTGTASSPDAGSAAQTAGANGGTFVASAGGAGINGWDGTTAFPEKNWSFKVGAGASAGVTFLPEQAYIGREMTGMISTRDFGFAEIDEEDLTLGFDVSLGTRFEVGGLKLGASLSGYRYTVDAEEEFPTISLGSGYDLLIPGTGDPTSANPNGFVISGAFPGFSNDIQNAQYEADFESIGGAIKFGTKIPIAQRTAFVPYVGAGYSEVESEQRFWGSVPDFGLDFRYRTDVDTDIVSLKFGGAFKHRFAGPCDWLAIALGGGGIVDFVDGDGFDHLDVTGFGAQQVDISESDTSLGYTVGAGVYIGEQKSPLKFSVGFQYIDRDIVPVVDRPASGQQSQLDYESAETVIGTVRTTFRF